jgi:hypothetical protein
MTRKEAEAKLEEALGPFFRTVLDKRHGYPSEEGVFAIRFLKAVEALGLLKLKDVTRTPFNPARPDDVL